MATATRKNYSELDNEWDVDEVSGTYTSRIYDNQETQRLIFNEPFRDGTISGTIAIRDGEGPGDAPQGREGAFVFRFQDPNNYYFAGVGGSGGRFFIAKNASNQYQSLVKMGHGSSIKRGDEFRIEIRCAGNRITLSHNGITQLSILEDTFNSGPWGLHTWSTVAEFRDLALEAVKPTCFVIMPFAPEFDAVYRVIRETVERHGFTCVRADERYLSGPIFEDIIDQIENADMVIADFTGKNANVFYEAGYAAAIRKPVIQIAQSVSDLPFDVRHLRTFSYNTRTLGDRKLAQDLGEAIRAATGFAAVR